MSQQINLYDPALLKPREWLTPPGLAAAAVALLVVVGAWAGWVRHRAAGLEAEAAVLAPQLKTVQDQLQALGRDLAGRKPDPRLEEELTKERALADSRAEVLDILRKGLGPEAAGFAEYLRGLARQSPRGLWLTGFSVGQDGANLQIQGRTLDPALLPEYIRRLNAENIFQGRSFAALQLKAVAADPAKPAGAPVPAAAASAAPTVPAAPAYHEFTLVPTKPATEKRP